VYFFSVSQGRYAPVAWGNLPKDAVDLDSVSPSKEISDFYFASDA
jgi:hypothetical protein